MVDFLRMGLHKYALFWCISVRSEKCRSAPVDPQNVIDDLPPGGFPEYLTEVKAPGPAWGLASLF